MVRDSRERRSHHRRPFRSDLRPCRRVTSRPMLQLHVAGRIVVLALLLASPSALLPVGRATAGADVGTPLGAVRSAIDKALRILGDERMPVEQRRRDLRQLAETHLDLARMARGTLGDHWSQLSEAQRARYVPLFAAFIEDAYLDQIQDYVKLRIDVSTESVGDQNHARVFATVLQPGEEPLPIAFVLENNDNRWLVYDIEVENISMVQNYRAQFDRVIRDHGIGDLMNRLRKKQTQLEALLGQSTADSSH